jgi:ATP-dependent DNA helicase RecQ
VAAGWVGFTGGDRPVVLLTEEGRAVMKGARPARILLPPLACPAPEAATGRRRAPRPVRTEDDATLDGAGQALFEALRRHRLGLARSAGVAPFVIASDRTLRDLARLRPRSREELALAYGIGARKAEHYGEGLLRVIRDSLEVATT